MPKILVIGAARSGVALTELLLEKGCEVTLTDTKPEESIAGEFPDVREALKALEDGGDERLELLFGEQIPAGRLGEFDAVAPSPGVPDTVPIIAAADAAGVPVLSEPELSYRMAQTPFVAITGTNGKTTTTTLTGEIFKAGGYETHVVGNIGEPISRHVLEGGPDGVFVTEIGSFQLSRCYDFKPRGALILNITPDHLDRHKTMENYIAAKARVLMNQDGDDFFVLNLDDPIVRGLGAGSPAARKWISLNGPVDDGAYLDGDTLTVADAGAKIPLVGVAELGIKGPHNIQNALGASALAYFYGVPVEAIAKALKGFKGVEHRQEFVAEINGVRYINDSKGTNTDATITALNAMEQPVVLIAGGYDKREDYSALSEKIKDKVRLVVLLGQTADDIEASLRGHGFGDIIKAGSFDEAVDAAKREAKPGEAVLLSPACASWDMFDNFEQRGELFKKLVLGEK